jgi:hypothetical protein
MQRSRFLVIGNGCGLEAPDDDRSGNRQNQYPHHSRQETDVGLRPFLLTILTRRKEKDLENRSGTGAEMVISKEKKVCIARKPRRLILKAR